MKLTALFNKPRWQSRNASERRDAVARDQTPELIAELARFAREDDDAQVRLAALQRLADPAMAQRMAHDDADAEVRKQARSLWLDLLAGRHAKAPSVAERLRLLRAQEDPELDEHVANRATEAPLRQAALARIDKPSLLLTRALEDPDPAIRLALVERIDDEKQLERLAERARKSDKAVSRRARERIEALRIASGQDAAVEQRARKLCEQIEQCLRVPSAATLEAELIAQWRAVEALAPASLRTRFATALELIAAARAPRPPAAASSAPAVAGGADTASAATVAAPAADSEASADDAAAADLSANLIAQARFAASLDEAQAAQRERQQHQRALLHDLQQAQRDCAQALDAGAAAQAHQAKARIDALREQIEGALPGALQQALAATQERYAELARWQHWADNQRRRQLCEDLEALPAAGLHPDAVAAKVRDAQREWQLLDKVEGGSARVGGLARRFHGACRAALEPARGYFRKRQELREGHAAQVAALLARIAALPTDATDPALVRTLRQASADALRDLDRIEPRERKGLAQSLKDALRTLDAQIARRDDAVAALKSGLIAQAQALAGELPRGAAASARDLQARWREAGNGKRARDQAQWQEFRSALDRVFGQLDAQRAERSQREDEARNQALALCAELEAIASTEAEPERGAVTRIETAWNALRVDDAGLRQRHAAAQARLRDRAHARERARRQARFLTWQERYRLCRNAETGTGDDARTQWPQAAASDIASIALTQRFEQALAGQLRAAEATDAHRDVLVELEALAGIDSPTEDQERRRARQVERLSARMGGRAPSDAAHELTGLLERWSGLAPAVPALDLRLDRALRAALDALP